MNQRLLFNIAAAVLAMLYVAGIVFALTSGITKQDVLDRVTNKYGTRIAAPVPKKELEPETKAPEETRTKKFWPQLGKAEPPASWAYYIKRVSLDRIKASNKELLVVDTASNGKAFSKSDVEAMKKTSSGKTRKVLAYLSLGEVEAYRPYWQDSWDKSPPSWLGEQHVVWAGVYQVKDLMGKDWTLISKRLISEVIEAGFDGMMVAGLSVRVKNSALYLAKAIEYAKKKDSNFLVYVQDFNSPEVIDKIDGVVKQGLTYDISGSENAYFSSELRFLKEVKDKGKAVLVIEYVDADKWRKAKDTIDANGFVGYRGPLELNKIVED